MRKMMKTELKANSFYMHNHEPWCEESFETLREDITKVCFDCREHCAVIMFGCDCGEFGGELSSCCGSKFYLP